MPGLTATCASCRTRPVRTATLCRDCVDKLARNLGDVAALTAEAQRAYVSDDRTKGTDDLPLVRSRRRQLVPKVDPILRACPLDPHTRGPVLVPEPLRPAEFGRAAASPWDADHGLGREIDATIARQTATRHREGGRSSSRPLPYNSRAAQVAHDVHNTLGSWVRDLHNGAEPWPRDDVVAFAAWLLSRTDRIGQHPAADDIERDVHRVVERLRQAVDVPADLWWMGPCDTEDCLEEHRLVDDDGTARVVRRPTELYADPEAKTVTCRGCKVEYSLEDRRAMLLAAAEDQLAHAELIGRAAPALGVEITPAAVRGYADRKRIVAHGTDLQGRPLYRVGDVINVARDVLAARAEAQARREAERARRAESKRSA